MLQTSAVYVRNDLTRKILVVEDETETRGMILECLEAEGFRVFEANSGRLGVQQAQVHQPDIVICDIMMPDLDGYDVLKALRKSPATAAIPFIFLTAKIDRLDQRRGMLMGADDYITKPFTIEELVGAIAARLEFRDFLKQLYTAESSEQDRSIAALQEQSAGTLTTVASPHFQFPEHPQLREIFAFVEANYCQPIGLNEIAQAFGYSPSYLTSLVRRLTGQTVYQWIVQRRMFQARRLLLETDWAVHQIAEAVGYIDTGHFVKHFRQLHQQPPKAWRDAKRHL
jgi:YesN/AraC family two-component response regulator